MSQPDKLRPFRTYDQQIDILIERNITIENREEAISILREIPYYTLINGYKSTFLHDKDESDNFIVGTTLEMLQSIHYFDMSLSTILLKYILHIEKSFKSKVAYCVASNFGATEREQSSSYLNPCHYTSSFNQSGTLKRIQEALDKPFDKTVTFHYKNTKDHTPPWIIVNDITFGLVIQWYRILKSQNKQNIQSQYFTDTPDLDFSSRSELLIKTMQLLKDYRNLIAHGNRTFSSHVRTELPIIPLLNYYSNKEVFTAEEYHNGIGKKDIFSAILAISATLNHKYAFINFTQDFSDLILKYSEGDYCGQTILDIFSIPADILNRIDKIFKKKFDYKSVIEYSV